MKEAIEIRRKTSVMNRDEGAHRLSHVYNPVLAFSTETEGQGRRYPNVPVKILIKTTGVVETVNIL